MPRAKRVCSVCDQEFQPSTTAIADRGVCPTCYRIEASTPRKTCGMCQRDFSPLKTDPDSRYCSSCIKAAAPKSKNKFLSKKGELPKAEPGLKSPMIVKVFDLETWALDRGWGVVMVGSILTHGDGPPRIESYTLRDFKSWPKFRSNDSELAAALLKNLSEAHILIAHNGLRFDIPYLNSAALKYGMPRLTSKLIDPVQLFRQKYRIGSNSLGAIAQFLNLEEQKMPVTVETWRRALLDNDDASWDVLVERCESDVRVLNSVASAVGHDVQKIDYKGSAW